MNTNTVLCNVLMIAASLSQIAAVEASESGHLFGDRFGNTHYQILEKNPACGYGNRGDEAAKSIAIIEANSEEFKIFLGDTVSGRNERFYSVISKGTVSPSSLGIDNRYASQTVFSSLVSTPQNPADPASPIILTEESFAVDPSTDVVTYVKLVSDQVVLVCHYQRLTK